MSKTAEAWARIRAEQEKIGRMAIGIMVSSSMIFRLFGDPLYRTVVTRMGEVTFYVNDDLADDELIVL